MSTLSTFNIRFPDQHSPENDEEHLFDIKIFLFLIHENKREQERGELFYVKMIQIKSILLFSILLLLLLPFHPLLLLLPSVKKKNRFIHKFHGHKHLSGSQQMTMKREHLQSHKRLLWRRMKKEKRKKMIKMMMRVRR